MTTNYLYNVSAKYENAEIEIRTNDGNLAIEEFFTRVEDDVPTVIINGITGEVLVSANNGENNWLAPEWDPMLFIWLMKNQRGEGITVEEEKPETEFDSLDLDLMNRVVALISAE